jgi:hypothetical protein
MMYVDLVDGLDHRASPQFVRFVFIGAECGRKRQMLMGEAALPGAIRRLTSVAANHHPLIEEVDPVIAYRLGPRYFADVSVALRGGGNAGGKDAQSVGDSLAKRLVRIEDIDPYGHAVARR